MYNGINGMPNMYTPQDVRKYLHIGSQSAYNLFKRRDFPSIKIGSRCLISEENFLSWLEKESEKHSDLGRLWEKV